MIHFFTGPMLWATFIIFFSGFFIRLLRLIRISRQKDPVIHNHADFNWGMRSVLMWLLPFGSVAMRKNPVFTTLVFLFHLTLIATPLFLQAHNILWEEAFGRCLWSLPDHLADLSTILCIASGFLLGLRRILRPEVRILTEKRDYLFLILSILPFITGFLAYHQIGNYTVWILLHILSAELLLILIPFTKLAHMILFFFTRVFIGFEMGGRRGTKTW